MSDPRKRAVGVVLEEAVALIRGGGLVAFATETVWGLGADARSDTAIEKLRRFKGRAADAPVSILIEGPQCLEALGCETGAVARALARRFWPGPLTLVLPCKQHFAKGVARADGAVGVRCSSHPAAAALARGLADAGAGPLTATSLNRSGEPAAGSREQALAVCASAGDLDRAQEAPRLFEHPEDAGGGRESTVVDLCGEAPRVLRWGGIDEPRLSGALEEIAA